MKQLRTLLMLSALLVIGGCESKEPISATELRRSLERPTGKCPECERVDTSVHVRYVYPHYTFTTDSLGHASYTETTPTATDDYSTKNVQGTGGFCPKCGAIWDGEILPVPNSDRGSK